MTRQELLNRLQAIQSEGQDMGLPVVVRVHRRNEDKRRRNGFVTQTLFADVEYALSGSININDPSGSHAELYATVRDGYVGEFH